ncbi:MAG TPA: pseudouridine-5'-phosphate glycosidase, partial [Candidatus Nanopelagicales bacterium]|nr:pseudouridine-5'-phosphate glycosidase [Candidatus Nanopelagicales bacterium]
VPATLERLETLNIPVLGYRTDRFPGFYLADSGLPVGWTVDSPAQVAAVLTARDRLDLHGGVVIAQPLPPDEELDRALHDEVLASGLAAATERGVAGKDVTPFLLSWFHDRTAGASLTANVRLVLHNARLAAQVAVELADAAPTS